MYFDVAPEPCDSYEISVENAESRIGDDVTLECTFNCVGCTDLVWLKDSDSVYYHNFANESLSQPGAEYEDRVSMEVTSSRNDRTAKLTLLSTELEDNTDGWSCIVSTTECASNNDTGGLLLYGREIHCA